MKKIPLLLILMLSVSFSYGQRSGYVDDLYQSPTKKEKAVTPATTTYNSEPRVQTSGSVSVATGSDMPRNELITSYEEALQRRITALNNYREMDSDYWDLMDKMNQLFVSKYDQSFYHTVVVGNEMWVEPRYISAVFDGSDATKTLENRVLNLQQPKSSNVTVNINYEPSWWTRGWSSFYDPFWGPRYGWPGYYGYWGRPYSNYWFGYDYYSGWPGYWPGYHNHGYWPGYWPGGGYPGHYPPGGGYPGYYPGGGHNHGGRPVIWGSNSGGGGYGPGSSPAPSIRPGSGDRTVYRRNDNGTWSPAAGGGGADGNRRPAVSNNSSSNSRPSYNDNNRSYRNNTQSRPSTPSTYRSPSGSSSSGSSLGSSGSSGGGGGAGAGGFSSSSGGGRSR